MSTTFQQQPASLPIERVARRLSRATTLARQPVCAQAVAIRRKQYSRLLRNGILASKTPDAQGNRREDTHSLLRSASPPGLFFTVQRSTLKHNRGESPSRLSVIGGALLQERHSSVRCACPLSGIQRLSLFGSRKCIAFTGIAVGTSTEVRYMEEARYW